MSTPKPPTKRALDGGDSTPVSGTFLASSFLRSRAAPPARSPAPGRQDPGSGAAAAARPSSATHDFLTRIPQNALAGVQVAAFDTRTDPDKLTGATRVFAKILDRFGYAAPKISSSLENKGGQVVKLPEGFIVLGTEGPLLDGELERAADWGRQVVRSGSQASGNKG